MVRLRHLDADLTNPEAFRAVRELVERTDLDLSDAFQIFSVKYGYFSVLAGESRTVLVTTDGALAAAARSEGISVWNVALEVGPQ